MATRGNKLTIKLIHINDVIKTPQIKDRGLPENFTNRIKEFSYICFSLDDQYIATLSTEVEPIILLWSLAENSNLLGLVASYRISGSPDCFEIKISPSNSTLISVLGKNNFKLLNHNGGSELTLAMNNVYFKDSKATVIFYISYIIFKMRLFLKRKFYNKTLC